MKRKLLTILLAIVSAVCLSFGIAACTNSGEGNGNNGGKYTQEQIDEMLKPFNYSVNDGKYIITEVKDNHVTSVTIPDFITSIDRLAFANCFTLIEVYNLSSLNITAGSSDNGYVGYYAKDIYTSTDVPSKLTTTQDGFIFYDDTANGNGYYLMGYAGNSTDIVLPKKFNSNSYSIYQCAFYKCTSLTSIIIPDNVMSIGDYAFCYCISLASATIGNDVTSIGKHAFGYCISLSSATIGSAVTSIEDGAFNGCSKLTSAIIPDSVTSIGINAFRGCTAVKIIMVGSGVTSIGAAAFGDCSSLTSITFNGTKAQWNAIEKGRDWNACTGDYTIHCTDGNIEK